MGISNGIIISTEQSKNIEVEIIHRENSVQTFARLKCGLCYNVILAAGVLSKDSIFDSLFKNKFCLPYGLSSRYFQLPKHNFSLKISGKHIALFVSLST